MSFCVDCFSKAIREPECQTGNLPVPYCNAVVWQTVLVDADVVQGYLTTDASAYVTAAVWSNGVVVVTKGASKEELMVWQCVHDVWCRYGSADTATEDAGACHETSGTARIHEAVRVNL